MKRVAFLLLSLSLISLVSCTDNNTGKRTMTVASETRRCHGEGPMNCMMVKYEGENDWTFFYGNIEGFDYAPGYEYVIDVRVTKVENPPAGASAMKYELLKVVSKDKKNSGNLPSDIGK